MSWLADGPDVCRDITLARLPKASWRTSASGAIHHPYQRQAQVLQRRSFTRTFSQARGRPKNGADAEFHALSPLHVLLPPRGKTASVNDEPMRIAYVGMPQSVPAGAGIAAGTMRPVRRPDAQTPMETHLIAPQFRSRPGHTDGCIVCYHLRSFWKKKRLCCWSTPVGFGGKGLCHEGRA